MMDHNRWQNLNGNQHVVEPPTINLAMNYAELSTETCPFLGLARPFYAVLSTTTEQPLACTHRLL